MTWLRPHTASSIASWPETPVVYQRPVLRAISALFLVGFTAWDVLMVWFPPQDDPLLASDWWLGPGMFLMLGVLYLYVSARLVVTATQVLLQNPLRQVAIPLGQVTAVTPGENLKIETGYGYHAYPLRSAGRSRIGTFGLRRWSRWPAERHGASSVADVAASGVRCPLREALSIASELVQAVGGGNRFARLPAHHPAERSG